VGFERASHCSACRRARSSSRGAQLAATSARDARRAARSTIGIYRDREAGARPRRVTRGSLVLRPFVTAAGPRLCQSGGPPLDAELCVSDSRDPRVQTGTVGP
jgi:hypothetical protein